MPEIKPIRRAEETSMGKRTYRTILADPPWNIVQSGHRGAEVHYPLMDVETICELRVDRL